MSEESLCELADLIFLYFGEANPGVQAGLFKWKKDFEEVEALAKARCQTCFIIEEEAESFVVGLPHGQES
jgi:hypothetical protein